MIVSCARLAGERVLDPSGEDAGRIESVMIDLASGRIAGVVIACGGVLGLGERVYTVSWEQIRLDPARRRLILEEDRQEA